ncbi:mandelate racemase/muconate lactonizing enzyme family protein [Sediminicola luteus]|nr:mandelate racemase/muconate lactonizing enzyme family protein [Sediminicola luteus]
MKDQYNRRDFMNRLAGLSPILLYGTTGFSQKPKPISFGKAVVEKIELYRYDVNLARHFSFGVWKNRQVAFIRIISSGKSGWGEMNAGINKPGLNLEDWGQFLRPLLGKSIDDAFNMVSSHLHAKTWNWGKCEFVEMALYDLLGKLENRPALDLLGLTGNQAVHGLFPILEEDPDKVAKAAQKARDSNYKSHVKLKIFGNSKSDGELIQTAREVLGDQTYIVCDPNEGYKNWDTLTDLAQDLKYLGSCGMNGCEDPAKLTLEQWIDLQKMVDPITIIPDVILRPAHTALEMAKPGMGNAYNLHPATMGNFKSMVQLASKIKSWGHQLMIGDASLIGPGCSIWQQLAIGMGASWVEAIEKPIESDRYLPCIASKATFKDASGKHQMKRQAGFGVELDIPTLKEVVSQHHVI